MEASASKSSKNAQGAGEDSQETKFFDEVLEREKVRREEAKLAVQQAVNSGDLAAMQGDFDLALLRYREAQVILRYNPMISTPEISLEMIREKIQAAIGGQESGRSVRFEGLQSQAEAEYEKKQQERSRYLAEKIRTLFEKANQAFLNHEFEEAQGYLDQLLAIDPENSKARNLREVVVESRNRTANQKYQEKYREEWQRTIEKVKAADIVQTDTIEFDLKRWAEVLKRAPLEVAQPEAEVSPEEKAILNKLENTFFQPIFNDAPLEEVVQFFQNLTGVNFILSPAVQNMSPEEKVIGLELSETSVKNVLDIITEIRSVRYRIQHGVVKIIAPEEVSGGQYLAFYEVRDITRPISNFPAPEINLASSAEILPPTEDLPEPEAIIVDETTLAQLIQDNVVADSWGADGNSITSQQGTLIVRQSRDVHQQIKQLLDDLREATGLMVDVQVRFLTVEDNFLSDVGVDIRGLGDDAASGLPGKGTNNVFDDFGNTLPNTIGNNFDSGAFYDFRGDSDIRGRAENLYDVALGKDGTLTGSGGLSLQYTYLDDVELETILRAVEKSERIQIVQSSNLLIYNTQRASTQVLNKQSYISDFDVQVAQSAVIADPIVRWLHSGILLDVTPVVSSDRRFITMELRPTVANLKLPIQSFQTNLATGTPVSIQLPELEVQRVRTTVSIPDGGTLLLAGSTSTTNQKLDSGIPFLNKIPLLSFFFSRKGDFQQNKKLLILVRAKVVIPEEHEPAMAQAR